MNGRLCVHGSPTEGDCSQCDAPDSEKTFEVWDEFYGRASSQEVRAATPLQAAERFRDLNRDSWESWPRWGEKRELVVVGDSGGEPTRVEVFARPAIVFEFEQVRPPLPPPADDDIPF